MNKSLTADLVILITTFGAFVVYLICHVFIFRRISRDEVLVWLMRVWAMAAVFSFVIPMFFMQSLGLLYIEISFLALLMYTLLAVLYVLGIFGIIESSLRIRLLTMIAHSGEKGIEEKDIFRSYNKEVLVKRRVERFLKSGEMKEKDGYFLWTGKLSFFSVHDTMLRWLRFMYGV